ncbi:hypothetical protein FGIG_07700 [Fasciola gigantica]|uniref:Uncharacterized protein n=1 Tax=Fasciola gigantica TaxID=46835 RepID=A0A504YPM6_FASGI|nr:hypothetical protein FGIG_07700 [Fasciola gigantica]
MPIAFFHFSVLSIRCRTCLPCEEEHKEKFLLKKDEIVDSCKVCILMYALPSWGVPASQLISSALKLTFILLMCIRTNDNDSPQSIFSSNNFKQPNDYIAKMFSYRH